MTRSTLDYLAELYPEPPDGSVVEEALVSLRRLADEPAFRTAAGAGATGLGLGGGSLADLVRETELGFPSTACTAVVMSGAGLARDIEFGIRPMAERVGMMSKTERMWEAALGTAGSGLDGRSVADLAREIGSMAERLDSATALGACTVTSAGERLISAAWPSERELYPPWHPARFDLPAMPESPEPPVRSVYERLARRFIRPEAGLPEDQEIGARLVTAPGVGAFHVEDLDYSSPDLIVFRGTDGHGWRVELVQHYSQLSIVLTALPKEKKEQRRIGFDLERRLERGGPW